MSLLLIAASTALAAAAQPAHTVDMQHGNATYRVDYRPHVETSMRNKGMSAGARPSTQICAVSSTITVERVISSQQGGQELKAMLPAKKSINQHLSGPCRSQYGDTETLLANKEGAVRSLLSQAALEDRQAAVDAIDAARQFAAN